MPPRGHGSSSHSSSFHSSSSHSSFGSHHSRSSHSSLSSFSRSRPSITANRPKLHSSTSHFSSSGFRNSSLSGAPASSGQRMQNRPAPHTSGLSQSRRTPSYSSDLSVPSGNPSPYAERGSAPAKRPRANQPLYRSDEIVPWICYCEQHDYLHFSIPWSYAGNNYPAGYYDEDGRHYSSTQLILDDSITAAFAEAKCEYCGHTVSYESSPSGSMTCPGCGAPLPLSEADVLHDRLIFQCCYYPDTKYTSPSDENWVQEYYQQSSEKKKHLPPKLIIALLVILYIWGGSIFSAIFSKNEVRSTGSSVEYVQTASQTNPEIFGSTLYLSRTEDGIYDFAVGSAERVLVWDESAESYYDKESDAYLYYNTNVSPNLWQYWFEGISSEYGNYGWMECEGETWYIQNAQGNWVKYSGDTSQLWHIRNSFDP